MDTWEKIDDKNVKKRIYKARTNVRWGKFFSLIFKCILIIIACILVIFSNKYSHLTTVAWFVVIPTVYVLVRTIVIRIQEYRSVKKNWLNNDIYKIDGIFIETVPYRKFKFAKISTKMGDVVSTLMPEG